MLIRLCIAVGLAVPLVAQPPPPGPPLLRVDVNLVQVDAVVTDSHGRHVPDLRVEDFEIRQDGKLQKISHLSFIADTSTPYVPTRKKASTTEPVPEPAPQIDAAGIRRTIALVVDDLGLTFENVARIRDSLRQFVDQDMQPGDLVAIICTGRGASAFQQFTVDKRILRAAIEQVRYNFNSRAQSFISVVDQDDREWEREHFTAGTLGALQYIIQGLRGLPGRKSAILFSQNLRVPPDSSRSWYDRMDRLADQANRSGVVLYTIDPRGIFAPPGFSADKRQAVLVIHEANGPKDRALRNLESQADQQNSTAGLYYLARQTGGMFLQYSNDIAGMIRQSVDDQVGYYLLGYRPDPDTFEKNGGRARYHRIEVKVLRPGLQVRSRTGFLGTPDAPASDTPRSRGEQIAGALASPFRAADVPVRLTSWFDDEPGAGPSILSMVHIDARSLFFSSEPDGWKKALVDVVTLAFGDEGRVVSRLDRTYTVRARGPVYDKLLDEGLVYTTSHPVKASGAFQYRVVVRDALSGQVGSASQFLEVPSMKKGRMAVSGIVLLNATNNTVRQLGASDAGDDSLVSQAAGQPGLRRYQYGQKIAYSYRVLNATRRVETEIRLFRAGSVVLRTPPDVVVSEKTGSPNHKRVTGILTLGSPLLPGDYVMQVAVTDKATPKKPHSATGWIDFELLLAPGLK